MTDDSGTWSFEYNADGLRVYRSNGTSEYKYYYNGDKLSRMVVNGQNITFGYDANGTPQYVLYEGNRYFYLTNLQGDVTAIVSVNGNVVVEYTYDAWGNVLDITGVRKDNLGKLNPLRYRGYVYDDETGLYYLQSRYYDPALGRFINADVYTSTGQDFIGHNMFAYCGNNPTSRADQSGRLWNYVIGAVVGGVVSAVTTAVQSYKETGEVNLPSTVIAGMVGAVGGAVAASGLNCLVQAGITMAAAAAGDISTQAVEAHTTGAKYNPMQTIHNTLLAGGCSILGSGLGSLASYGQTALGSELLEKGAEKAGQAFGRSNLGLSSSKLVRQAETLLRQGNISTNIGRGISSVTGTLLTWGVSVEYSY